MNIKYVPREGHAEQASSTLPKVPLSQMHMARLAEPDVCVPEGSTKKGAKLFKSKCAQCNVKSRYSLAPIGR